MADVTLYQFPGAYGLVSLSPFCTKLEAYLRLAGVDYEAKLGDPRRAPVGKLPYVRIGDTLVGDSSTIVTLLKTRFGDPLDASLDARDHAVGHLARRTAEEHLYWGLLHARWVDDRAWNGGYRDTIAGMLPAPTRAFLPALLRRGVRKSLHAHGLGRHAEAEIARRGTEDLDAFVALIGERAFLFGDAPSSYDCSVYAMLAHLRATPTEHPLVVAFRERPTLAAYCDRMNERIAWPT
ncbi:MAG: glutathione S-transferase family protein [Sandaracinus sp.]|nr:glutathione S-transferase family protein [Sandaracinus sp.]